MDGGFSQRPKPHANPRQLPESRDWRRLDARRIPGTLSWDPALLARLSGSDVLDLGCGPKPSFEGLDHFSGHRVGVDSNPDALRAARLAVPGASFVSADITSLPFPDATFDLVLCKAVLTALVDDDTCHDALAEAARVLRPGGALLTFDFLVNESDAYFTDRYRAGKAASLPPGAFEAKAEDGSTLYVARHFAPSWIGEQAESVSTLALESCEERPVTTRSGRATRGFIALLRRSQS